MKIQKSFWDKLDNSHHWHCGFGTSIEQIPNFGCSQGASKKRSGLPYTAIGASRMSIKPYKTEIELIFEQDLIPVRSRLGRLCCASLMEIDAFHNHCRTEPTC